jgi:gluconolactonase
MSSTSARRRPNLLCLTCVALIMLGACNPSPSPADGGDTTDASTTVTETGIDTSTSTDTGTDTDTETGTDTDEPQACWTDLMFGEHEVIYQGFAGGSEGISFGESDGRLYVSSNNRVWQVDADGNSTEFAQVPDAIGLAAIAGGDFVVASLGEITQPDGAIYIVDAMGVAELLATGIDSPNFVTIAPDGSALVSDDYQNTRVFRVTLTGEISVVIEDVPSPNGMAYSPDGELFYVASTFTPEGQLTRYEVGPDGMPIEATGVEILQLGMASTPDGVAVDANGWVYVAANLRGEIWRVDGAVAALQAGELVANELGFPASLAFGRGAGFDPCSLYVTQLQNDTLQRVAIGVAGAPLYY